MKASLGVTRKWSSLAELLGMTIVGWGAQTSMTNFVVSFAVAATASPTPLSGRGAFSTIFMMLLRRFMMKFRRNTTRTPFCVESLRMYV